MDPAALGALIPIVAIIMGGLLLLNRQRMRQLGAGPSRETTDRLDALEQELDAVRRELGETQERLDFTERLLTQAREEKGLNPPS